MRTSIESHLRQVQLAAFILGAVMSPAAIAADDKRSLKDQLGDFTADLGIPATPAAVLVGLSGENVIMPKNRREFEAGISKLFDGSGRPTGAIEFAPYYIFRGGKLSYPTYRASNSLRSLTKTTLGLASGTRQVDNKELSATGYSLSTVLYDLADPIYSLALENCINAVQGSMLERAKSLPVGSGSAAPDLPSTNTVEEVGDEPSDDQAVKDYKSCLTKNQSTAKLWNRSKLAIGVVGGKGREGDGEKRSVSFGTSVWLSAQYGFEGWDVLRRTLGSAAYYDCDKYSAKKDSTGNESTVCDRAHTPSRWEQSALLTLHARQTRHYSDLDLSQVGELRRLSNRLIGARLTYGSDRRNFFIEASEARVSGDAETKRIRQQAFGASFRVSDNLWINAVSARRKNFINDKLDTVMDLGLQFGAASEPLVNPIK